MIFFEDFINKFIQKSYFTIKFIDILEKSSIYGYEKNIYY